MFHMFQVNVSVVLISYMYHMQMNVVTHKNTLAIFRMSLGTMFMKVISPNYAYKY
jgi:hypothetical protein